MSSDELAELEQLASGAAEADFDSVADLCDSLLDSGHDLADLVDVALRWPSVALVCSVGAHATRLSWKSSLAGSEPAVRALVEAAPAFERRVAAKLLNLIPPIQARGVTGLTTDEQRGVVAILRAGLQGDSNEADQAIETMERALVSGSAEPLIGGAIDSVLRVNGKSLLRPGLSFESAPFLGALIARERIDRIDEIN